MALTRRAKALVSVAVATIAVAAIGYSAVSYHGPTDFPTHASSTIDPDRVVSAARRLHGTLYDPLMGKFGNLGGKLGFIVCSDVPVVAYGAAGFSFRQALADDFVGQPSNYDSRAWNVPDNPYFHRRARNLYAFFEGNGRLLGNAELPLSGDLVFYKKERQSYPTHVAVVSRVESAERYWIVESAPGTVLAREVPGDSPVGRGWVPLGFGRVVSR